MLFKEDFIEQCDEILNLLESDLDNEFGKSSAKTAETINNLNGQKVAKLEAQAKRTKYNTYSENKSVAENAKKNLSRQRAELAEAKYNKKKALNTMRMIKNQNDNIANTINSSYEDDFVTFDDLITETENIENLDLYEADDARIETAERQKDALKRREQDLTQKYQKEKMDIQKQRQRIQDTIDYARSINQQSEKSDNADNTVQESVKELADNSAENNDAKKLVFEGSNGDLFQYLIYKKKSNNSEINYQAIDAIVNEHDGAMYVQKLKSEINKAEPSADVVKQLKQKIINIYKRVEE